MLKIILGVDRFIAVDDSEFLSKKPKDNNDNSFVYLLAVDENLQPSSGLRNKHCTQKY